MFLILENKLKSIIYKRNSNFTANKAFGLSKTEESNIGDLINHEYMNSFTQKIKERSDKIRRENQDKMKRLKDYSGYKTNNTSLKRSTEIK